jgi:thiol-disulfide isomerase/thioredoxin
MVEVGSTMLPLGTQMPPFALPDFDRQIVSSSDYVGAPATLVMFICNHCPYVRHVRPALGRLSGEYRDRGVAVIAINSNDVAAYPQDGPDGMRDEAKQAGYLFPYLFDQSQQVAKAYRAACTPDFYVFDAGRRLAYRGQLDDTRPGSGREPTGKDLRRALDDVLTGRPVTGQHYPSAGCSIKWRPGNEPRYELKRLLH